MPIVPGFFSEDKAVFYPAMSCESYILVSCREVADLRM